MNKLIIVFITVAMHFSIANADKPGEVISLFNGKDLTGWEGRKDLWSVEDGMIVGRTVKDKPLKKNTFLVWKAGEVENFELSLEYKIEGGNSGIQYRSEVKDQKEFVVGGYQADIDSTNKFAGILYEEKGRGILCQRGDKTTIDASGKKSKSNFADSAGLAKGIHPGKWNSYRVVAKGNHLMHFINEAKTAEVIDEQSDKAAKKGVLAFQLRQGPPMVIRFKYVSLKVLK